MGEIRIDYDLMHNLAMQMYALRGKIDDTSKVDHEYPSSDIGPDPNAGQAITDFYGAWKKAFHRAWDAMTTLGDDFNSAANAFFDTDSQLATSMNQQSTQIRASSWDSKKQAYDEYMKHKGESHEENVTDRDGNIVYGSDGKPETKQVADWTQEQADKMNPGSSERPTDYTTFGAGLRVIHTHLIYDGDKLVGTESTVSAPKGYEDVTAPTDMSYKETTMYSANGGYITDIHYVDGTEQKIVVVAQSDGSATKSVYDGSGKLTDQYTGNVKTDKWDKSWDSQKSDPNDNPQKPDNPDTDPEYYNYGTGH